MKYSQKLKSALCDLYGMKYAVLFGHARAGIVALMDILDLSGRQIVIPSNICPIVGTAILASNGKISLVPASSSSGISDDDAFIRIVDAIEKPGLIMPTHMYGSFNVYANTLNYGKNHNVFILENDTLCASRIQDGIKHAFGDAVLTSFGYSKTINFGLGGALLTDDFELSQEIEKYISGWSCLSQSDIEVENQITVLRRKNQKYIAQNTLGVEIPLLRRRFPDKFADGVIGEITMMSKNLNSKNVIAKRWLKHLSPLKDAIEFAHLDAVSPWRLIVKFPNKCLRDHIVADLRSINIDAGTNFPNIQKNFPDLIGNGGEINDAWGDMVMNLWLDESYDDMKIGCAVRHISKKILFEKNNA